MDSHLHHTVKPLKEVRADIPLWACDWIMWQINRYPQDRPESARDALSVFLKNDRIPNAAMSTGQPKAVAGPPRPRLVIPGSGPPPPRLVIPGSGPPPRGNDPATQALAKAKLVQTSQVTTLANEGAPITQTAPQPLAPPEGFKPSVHTSLQELPNIKPADARAAADAGHPPPGGSTTQRAQRPAPPAKKPFRLGKTPKIALTISAVILLAVMSVLVVQLVRMKRDQQVLTELLAQAERPDPGKIKVDAATLRNLFKALADPPADSLIQGIAKVLTLAEATDGTDVDSRVADFATKRADLPLAVQEVLIGQVLQARSNPVILPAMMEFATNSKDPALVVSALQAVRTMAGEDQFTPFLKLIESTNSEVIRDAAELNIESILRKSKKIAELERQLESARDGTLKPEVQKTLRLLLSVCKSVKAPTP